MKKIHLFPAPMLRTICGGVFFSLAAWAAAQAPAWPEVSTVAKPGARWWWLGSAVDSVNLAENMADYARTGLGTLEITPIYGVKNNEANDIDFLSPRWMRMYSFVCEEVKRLGLNIDMNTGTGWPFGGPEVTVEDAATKVIFQRYTVPGGTRLQEPVVVADKPRAFNESSEQNESIFGQYRLAFYFFVPHKRMPRTVISRPGAGFMRSAERFSFDFFHRFRRTAPHRLCSRVRPRQHF